MRRVWADIIALSSLVLVTAIFFCRLFYPVPSIVVTPDYGRSDAWHFSFATKYALSESLKTNTLPLWRNDIGDGFPLFAEGQTGAFFLPNLLLFRLLPMVTAYNIALTLTVLMLGIGMYWWCRVLLFSALSSWFASISVMFSGLTMAQLPHITLLQGISMLPIIATLSCLVVLRGPYPWGGFLSLALAQQITAGFPQATLLTLIISVVFVAYFSFPKKNWTAILLWMLSVGLGIGGGAVQILPSWEFLQSSTDPGGFTPSTATMYSMPLKHLASFLFPFALGNPKFASYPPFYAFDGSIFWENTPYIGILPLLFFAAGVFLLRKQRLYVLLILGCFVSLLLAGGKYAPTYILFSIWPLTLFRVPSRFLWLTIIAVSMIGSMATDRLMLLKRASWVPKLVVVLLALHTFQLLNTWWSYHLIEPANRWIQKPEITTRLSQGRVITIGHGAAYNRAVTQDGWSIADPYHFLREGVPPDSNMLWHVSQHNVYAGRYLKRPAITDSLLTESIQTDERMATVSAGKFLNFFSIRYILSFLPLDSSTLDILAQQKNRDATLTLYANPDALPRAYLVYEASQASTLSQAVTILTSADFIPGSSVLLEQHEADLTPDIKKFFTTQPETQGSDRENTITWEKDTHNAITLSVTTDINALLVLTDTFYPGWHVRIDGEETKVFAANLSQRAVMIPSGTHTVTFYYYPVSLLWGAIASLVSGVLIGILMVVLKRSAGVRIQKKAPRPALHPPNTRRT